MLRILTLPAVVLALTGISIPSVADDKGKEPRKPMDLPVCPETEEKVKGEPAGSEVVGKYKVYFCCAGCREEFAKLSKAEKETKVADLAKRVKPGKKG